MNPLIIAFVILAGTIFFGAMCARMSFRRSNPDENAATDTALGAVVGFTAGIIILIVLQSSVWSGLSKDAAIADNHQQIKGLLSADVGRAKELLTIAPGQEPASLSKETLSTFAGRRAALEGLVGKERVDLTKLTNDSILLTVVVESERMVLPGAKSRVESVGSMIVTLSDEYEPIVYRDTVTTD